MGSKDRVPPPHLRRPPPGPGMVHPDPFGPGIHSSPGPFPRPDMLPPPEIMEQKLAAQHVEMQRLATENQRLAATHGTLRQELAAAQHELQILHAQIGAVNSEREQHMRSLKDTIAKMEADLKAAEPVKLELQQAHTEAQIVILARDELMSKIHQLNLDLQRVHVGVQQIPALMSELESLRQEYHHCRATFDCEKKFYNDHLESLQVMEKNYMTMAREVEKLRAELTRACSVAGNNENEASGHPMGHIPFEDAYGVRQGHGPLPAVVVGTAAYIGAQSGSFPAPARALGYYPQRGPGYDASRGATYDAQDQAAAMAHGQVLLPNDNVPNGSGTPAHSVSGYKALPRGGNLVQR